VGDPAHILEWDSNWWGMGVARLDALPETPDDVVQIDAWCNAYEVDVLMALVPERAARAHELLDPDGSRTFDRRVTYSRNLEDLGAEHASLLPDLAFRLAQPGDARSLGELASRSHLGTRFFRDPNFDDERCYELYRRWIEQECVGRADFVVVAASGDDLVGYCSVARGSRNAGARISLIAVDDDHQNRGIATHLVHDALGRSSGAGSTTMDVATQGDNVTAQHLYRKTGFEERQRDAWVHRWYRTP